MASYFSELYLLLRECNKSDGNSNLAFPISHLESLSIMQPAHPSFTIMKPTKNSKFNNQQRTWQQLCSGIIKVNCTWTSYCMVRHQWYTMKITILYTAKLTWYRFYHINFLSWLNYFTITFVYFPQSRKQFHIDDVEV